ncbi:serine/threonine-protein kinase [Actinoplanes sp. NPDC051346]|uniref:serine/threonine-protein kinase n=1 Tax=Actinoplanes sp. NPDC051346 TaxID=3155048 RepID=UPI00343E5F1C
MPTKIGRYRVARRLGSGAFATVWLAEDDVLESWVAIKVLADNWAHHLDVRARFEQEAQVLRRADSERLVRVHDFGELPDGRSYQVMTYASGGTLADRLAAGALPVDTAVRNAVEIAHAVTVLHDAGVLHRDLKPSNILFDTVRGGERVLVADLGLAKEIAHASGFTVVAGTPGYMAPEQGQLGGGVDVRADVYALGALAYQMLTGRTPRANGTDVVAPSKLALAVPKRIDRVVLRAIDADRNRRWPTAAAFAAALTTAHAGPVRRGGARSRRLIRFAGTVVAAAAILAVGGATVPDAAPAHWVRVADESGKLSLAVPAAWAGQLKNAGWDPGVVGLPAGRARGLLVGADLAGWANPRADRPGVFAGVVDAPATARLPAHDDCVRQPDRPVAPAGLSGQVRRWTGCGGTALSFSEVLLASERGSGVYVQIKQVDQVDRTAEVLRTLRVS